MTQKTWFTIISHTKGEKSVGITAFYLHQITVLDAVDKLLRHHSRSHLRIVHIREEALSRILTIRHKGRQHLSLLPKEQRTTTVWFQLIDRLSVNQRILIQPQMTVGIDYEFFHLTNI